MTDDGLLAQWLQEKLSNERRVAETRHARLLKEFSEHQLALRNLQRGQSTTSLKESSVNSTISLPRPLVANLLQNDDPKVPVFADAKEHEEAPAPVRFKSITGRVVIEDEPEKFTWRLVTHPRFECFFACVILLNILVMALEAQHHGVGLGHEIGYQNYDTRKEDLWVGATHVFVILDCCFGVLYSCELALKIIGLRKSFLDRWNLLDSAIVAAWYFDKLADNVRLPIDMMILRLLRLTRLLRLVQLAKALLGFDQLLLITTALKGSCAMLFWSALTLCSLIVMFAFFLNQLLVEYAIHGNASLEQKKTCFMYFGTFTRSVFSMFELTLGNWIPLSRFLIDNISELFTVFTLCYKIVFGFAVVAVINGCFIKETFRIAAADDQLMVLEKEREQEVHTMKMSMLLEAFDADQDGVLNRREFETGCQDQEVKAWLGAQGLDARDADKIFLLMDHDKNEHLKPAELVEGVKTLKGCATSLDFAFESWERRQREDELACRVDEIMSKLERMESLFAQQVWNPE